MKTRWFAWRPVRIQFTNRYVWLKYVNREIFHIPIASAMNASVTVKHYTLID